MYFLHSAEMASCKYVRNSNQNQRAYKFSWHPGFSCSLQLCSILYNTIQKLIILVAYTLYNTQCAFVHVQIRCCYIHKLSLRFLLRALNWVHIHLQRQAAPVAKKHQQAKRAHVSMYCNLVSCEPKTLVPD
jgi:hypothetical protein